MLNKKEILQKLKNLFDVTFNGKVKDIVLFGSQTQNKEDKNSDFDILIVTKDVFTWKEKSIVRDICYDISVDFEVLIDSKIISQAEIENNFWGKHPLISDALNFGIHAE